MSVHEDLPAVQAVATSLLGAGQGGRTCCAQSLLGPGQCTRTVDRSWPNKLELLPTCWRFRGAKGVGGISACASQSLTPCPALSLKTNRVSRRVTEHEKTAQTCDYIPHPEIAHRPQYHVPSITCWFHVEYIESNLDAEKRSKCLNRKQRWAQGLSCSFKL